MSAKNDWWADQAALLDPTCHHYTSGLFDLTVPVGETWYVFNAWFVRQHITEPGAGHAWFHRQLGQPVMLPAGTRIYGTNQYSFLWYARPDALVVMDARYQDAENLYYERLHRLSDELPLHNVSTFRAAGSLNSAPPSVVDFPVNFANGLIVQASVHDGCWIILAGGTTRYSNVLNEINDSRAVRFTANMYQSFRRDMFDKLWLGRGAWSDDLNAPQIATEAAFGSVLYYKLPADW